MWIDHRLRVGRGSVRGSMEVDERRRSTATPSARRASVVSGDDAPAVMPGGPQSAPGQWSLPAFAPTAAAGQPLQSPTGTTPAGRHLSLPLVTPHLMMYYPPVPVVTSSHVTPGTSTHEHLMRRTSSYVSSFYNDQQQLRSVEQQQKRRRSCYSTDWPQRDPISSTVARSPSWNAFESSASSFVPPPHHHQLSYPSLSCPYRTGAASAIASSLSLTPWSFELMSARSGMMGSVTDHLGAARPPAYACPVSKADIHLSPRVDTGEPEPPQQQQQQSISEPATSQPSSFTAVVTHHCTSCGTCSSRSGDVDSYQPNEGSLSSPCDRLQWSRQRSPTPLPNAVRQPIQSVPETVATRQPSPPTSRSSAARTPGRFGRGSVIQLGGGRWKRVEQLSDEDFVDSAARKSDTQLAIITVKHIRHKHDSNSVVIGFQFSDYQVAVEVTREHPFFVCSKGWCSCSPQRTLDRYDLPCNQLVVGDCCLALSQITSSTFTRRTSAVVSSAAVPAERRTSSESGEGQLDAPLDYSRVGTAST